MRKPTTKPTKLAEERKWYSWLDKEQPDDKKISRDFCARKNIIRLESQRKITRSHQKSTADKKEKFMIVDYFLSQAPLNCPLEDENVAATAVFLFTG
ncbi:MAG: hypothetical protein CVU62_00055 [Deltaproteobacteria bacterium HGW-Deltaproteobacteria-2]|nr:MAG: hypothetical protein CVU62_00055 [Deltaproteobacteria bacterium HGW-Deltaproteobacteria-2]